MATTEAGSAAWGRLATAARDTREQLGLTQKQVAERSEGLLSLPVLQVIEGAKRTRYRRRTLLGLARALDWTDDSIDVVLAGGQPTSRTSPDRGDELTEALDDVRAALGRLERAVAGRGAPRLAR